MSSDNYKVLNGNMLEELSKMEENSIDSIITDPPYELNFMGKGWDNAGVSFQKETWEKCLRVLKPGGYLLAFGGSRTFHRIAVAIEDAGFEIRDTIMWLYGSGFPKSMDISKGIESKFVNGSANPKDFKTLDGTKVESGGWGISKMAHDQGARPSDYSADAHLRVDKVNYTSELAKKWEGWGTCLKPSFEPIIVARKPFDGSLIDNVIENGVGALNIDGCRIEHNEELKLTNRVGRGEHTVFNNKNSGFVQTNNHIASANPDGRFPSNTILTYDETDKEEVIGGFPDTEGGTRHNISVRRNDSINYGGKAGALSTRNEYNDSGNASRYFYCAKASKEDRDEGLEDFETRIKVFNGKSTKSSEDMKDIEQRFTTELRNTHPTVKPTKLMQYLIRLVSPKGSTVLDPFMGSGSTGKAAMSENLERGSDYKFIGVELSEEYCKIADARINAVCKNMRNRLF